jgi:hypothetical protein
LALINRRSRNQRFTFASQLDSFCFGCIGADEHLGLMVPTVVIHYKCSFVFLVGVLHSGIAVSQSFWVRLKDVTMISKQCAS